MRRTASRFGPASTTALAATSWRWRRNWLGTSPRRSKTRLVRQGAPPASPRPLPYRDIHGRNRAGVAPRAFHALRHRQLVAEIVFGPPNLAEVILSADLFETQ